MMMGMLAMAYPLFIMVCIGGILYILYYKLCAFLGVNL